MDSLKWPEDIIEEENRNKLVKAGKEYQRQLSRLVRFEKDGTQWSGIGIRLDAREEDLDESFRRQLADGTELNAGGHGTVRKVEYRKVILAVKELKMRWLSPHQIEQLKQEGPIGQRLDSHKHVIKHVGTYYQGFGTDDCRLHILTFPVAICDLSQLLDDCEEISQPLRNRLHDFMRIGERLVALGFHVSKEARELKAEIQSRLHEIMGCLAEAVKWMHSNDVRHRDLKPGNILLRPEQVLLTDFGISRHRFAGENTATETDVGFTWGYAAPEVLQNDGIGSLAKADVYSLGCVFLHILSVIHGPNADLGQLPPGFAEPRSRHHQREQMFRAYFDSRPVKHGSPNFPNHQFIPSNFVALLACLLERDSKARPRISRVNDKLKKICGDDEWLYGPCCRNKAQSIAKEKKARAGPNATNPLFATQGGQKNERSPIGAGDSKVRLDLTDARSAQLPKSPFRESEGKKQEAAESTRMAKRLGASAVSNPGEKGSAEVEGRTDNAKNESVKSDVHDFGYPSTLGAIGRSIGASAWENPLARAADIHKSEEKVAETKEQTQQRRSSQTRPRINVQPNGEVQTDGPKLEKARAKSDVASPEAPQAKTAQGSSRRSKFNFSPPERVAAPKTGSLASLRAEAQNGEFAERHALTTAALEEKRKMDHATFPMEKLNTIAQGPSSKRTPWAVMHNSRGDARSRTAELGDDEERIGQAAGPSKATKISKPPLLKAQSQEYLRAKARRDKVKEHGTLGLSGKKEDKGCRCLICRIQYIGRELVGR